MRGVGSRLVGDRLILGCSRMRQSELDGTLLPLGNTHEGSIPFARSYRADTKTDTNGAGTGWLLLAIVGVCWLDFPLAAVQRILNCGNEERSAAQRFRRGHVD